ncbi:hypothetical protein D3C81_1645790 [compost metagenome]
MLGAASVIGPTELDANTGTSISDLLQAFGLTITIGIILNGHHMNHHLIFRALQLANGLHQFHQVAQLVEHTKIGVCDDDALGTYQIGTEQLVKTQSSLIFVEDQMLLFQHWLHRLRIAWA